MWRIFERLKNKKIKLRTRPIVRITVIQEINPEGKVLSGSAFFTDGTPAKVTETVPIDAVGRLAFEHPDRINMIFVNLNIRDMPTAKEAKAGRMYLGVKKVSDTGWRATFGGLSLHTPPCACPHEATFDRRESKTWENKFRALGILLLQGQVMTKVHLFYDDKYPIYLHNPTENTIGWNGDDSCDSTDCP